MKVWNQKLKNRLIKKRGKKKKKKLKNRTTQQIFLQHYLNSQISVTIYRNEAFYFFIY